MWNEQFEVVIETLTGSEFIALVTAKDTVYNIKLQIQKDEGVLMTHQNLLYRNEVLDDNQMMQDIPLENGSRLKLVVDMKGGPISTRRLITLPDCGDDWIDLNEVLKENSIDPLLFDSSQGLRVLIRKDAIAKKHLQRFLKLRAADKKFNEILNYDARSSGDSRYGGWLVDNLNTLEKMSRIRRGLDAKKRNKETKTKGDETGDITLNKSENLSNADSLYMTVSSTKGVLFPPIAGQRPMKELSVDISPTTGPTKQYSLASYAEGTKNRTVLNKHGLVKTCLQPTVASSVPSMDYYRGDNDFYSSSYSSLETTSTDDTCSLTSNPSATDMKHNDFLDFFNQNNYSARQGCDYYADSKQSLFGGDYKSYQSENCAAMVADRLAQHDETIRTSVPDTSWWSNFARQSIEELISDCTKNVESNGSLEASSREDIVNVKDYIDVSVVAKHNSRRQSSSSPTATSTVTQVESVDNLIPGCVKIDALHSKRYHRKHSPKIYRSNNRGKCADRSETILVNNNHSMNSPIKRRPFSNEFKLDGNSTNNYEFPKLLVREDSPIDSMHLSDPQLETLTVRNDSPKTVISNTSLDNQTVTANTSSNQSRPKNQTQSVFRPWNHSYHSELTLNGLEFNFLDDDCSVSEGEQYTRDKESSAKNTHCNSDIDYKNSASALKNKDDSKTDNSDKLYTTDSINCTDERCILTRKHLIESTKRLIASLSDDDENESVYGKVDPKLLWEMERLPRMCDHTCRVDLNKYRLQFGSSPTLLSHDWGHNTVDSRNQLNRLDAVPSQYRRGYINLNDACFSSSTSNLEMFDLTNCSDTIHQDNRHGYLSVPDSRERNSYVRSYECLNSMKLSSSRSSPGVRRIGNEWTRNHDTNRLPSTTIVRPVKYSKESNTSTTEQGEPTAYKKSSDSLFNMNMDNLKQEMEVDELSHIFGKTLDYEYCDIGLDIDEGNQSTKLPEIDNNEPIDDNEDVDTLLKILNSITPRANDEIPNKTNNGDGNNSMQQIAQNKTNERLETTKIQQKKPTNDENRCAECNKKLNMMAMKCHCQKYFCSKHRYAEAHNCTFDFRSAGRKILERENPLIVASKLPKI